MVHIWLLSWSVWITISLELAVDNVPMIARGGEQDFTGHWLSDTHVFHKIVLSISSFFAGK